ncbi:MAG: tRNA (adenosine(37)-N6)-dimethylallyltransferase MiaA [Candidatus Obscuribacterales bacterium]|nr:tRNA (adenosine(37)-N6)-dimethylallyltransferase MiaA [Candidatus Obscuribacterales bacterium]
MKGKQKVVAIVGPTCTGKTALSIQICKKLPGEVICCDSRNIYKYFDIGSAKPTKEEQVAVPHHLFDLVEPDEDYTAARYVRDAGKVIEEISARGNLPVVCGGTGFYSRALLEGLGIPAIPPQRELREKLAQDEEQEPGILHQRLCELDPKSAARLNPRDLFRLIRALEVCITSGKPFSEQASKVVEAPYEVMWIGLSIKNRDLLRELIHKRLEEQMRQGMLEEVQALVARFGASQKMMNTVNYRDMLKHLSGEFTLKEAVAEAEKHNYQLARRQMMWFKNNPLINWFYVDELSREKIELSVFEKLEQFISQ